MTEVGRLFQMAGTAEIKGRPPYAVLVRGAWSRERVDERNVIVILNQRADWRLADGRSRPY